MIGFDRLNNPRRQNRRGFGVAAILYMLGLIGVVGGVLFSNNMQAIRSVMTVQNSLTVRSDLGAAANTLSAEAVFSTDNQLLCPPRSVHQSSGDPCTSAPVALTQLGDIPADPHLPANAAAAASTGAPVEVGVFPAGAGMKQLDANGHYYIYCRWENPRSSPASPAFLILSAGADGNLQTKCGDTTAKGDDALTMITVGEAINRAALWQSDASNNVSYGATGSKVTIDGSGDINAAGNITAGGSLNGQSASIANGLTALSITASGNISGSDLSGSSLEISGTAAINGATTLGTLSAQATTLDSLTTTHDATIGGGLTVQGGDIVLPNGYSYAQIDSTGNARRLIALSPENDILLGGHNGTGNIYFLTNNSTVGYVDIAGDLAMTGNIVGVNGNFSGNSTATNYTASDTVTGVTGNFQNLNANSLAAGNTTISGTLAVGGQTTGSSATYTGTVTAASFNGTMTLGGSGGVTISGVVPIANGGTGANNTATALNNLGVTSGGVFNTGLLSAGLINGGYLTSGTVTSTQLNATGVPAGNCPSPTVGADGRITACGTSVTVSAAGSTGDIQFNNSGNFAASNGLYWDNTDGYLGIGTTSPAGILDAEGGKAASNASGTNIKLAAQSGGTGNTNGGSIVLSPGVGSGTGFAGSVLIGSGCSAQSWISNGLCANGDIVSNTGFATADYQPYGWGQSSSQINGYGENSTNDQIRFITNNVERARFDGSGRLGIGTTNPIYPLQVAGIVGATSVWLSNSSGLQWGNATGIHGNGISGNISLVPFSSTIGLEVDSTFGVAIGSSYAGTKTAPANGTIIQGNVGIGTSAPDSQLEVYGALPSINLLSNQNAGKEYQFVADGNYAYIKDNTDSAGEFRIRSNGNNDVARFSYGGPANSFVLSSSGYVGIGTPSPVVPLDVQGGWLNGQIIVGSTGQSGNIAFRRGSDGFAEGFVGFSAANGGTIFNILNNSGASQIALGVNVAGTVQNILDIVGGSTGSVGIATTAPNATLDIAGYTRLQKYSSAPATCSATNDGAIALTSSHTLCVCNGLAWATTTDGLTACAWTASSAPVQIVLSTAGCSTWTVPANWNSANNKIEVTGAGAGGASFNFTAAGSVGGGGGAYSNISNLTLTPGVTINYCVGVGGNGETGSAAAQTGGDTWFNATTYASASVAAKGGNAVSNGNTGGVGGSAASGIGTVKNSGGNGGNSGTNNAGAGGGGAAGPDGNGLSGVAGASGSTSAGGNGGAGDNSSGGTAGNGGTSGSKNGSTGGAAQNGGGGAGGGYASGGNGGNGGAPGAGGGGGGSGSNSTNGGQGANGQIIITYTP